ncbi:MAG TPA: hypothetical protein ENH23_07330 [candidate division Zixibacteria bacterium]|nr:hypothetical protein [candidate division Zixibacteria bacterium]
MNSLKHEINRFFGFSAVLFLTTMLSATGLQTDEVAPAERDSKTQISQNMIDKVNDMQMQKLKYSQSKMFGEYSTLIPILPGKNLIFCIAWCS